MDSYLEALDADIRDHEAFLEYEATLPSNPEEYEAQAELDMEHEALCAAGEMPTPTTGTPR